MPSNYLENQRNWIRENNLQIGDYVTVFRVATSGERNWTNSWNSEVMDRFIGRTFRITSNPNNYNDSGIILEGYGFPFFVLEKVRRYEIMLDDEVIQLSEREYLEWRSIFLGENNA